MVLAAINHFCHGWCPHCFARRAQRDTFQSPPLTAKFPGNGRVNNFKQPRKFGMSLNAAPGFKAIFFSGWRHVGMNAKS